MSKITKRMSAFLLLITMLFSSTIAVHAETAAQMTNSMIVFFQNASNLNTDAISGNELAVYGVFLSNFMIPGATKSGDVTSDEMAETIADTFNVDAVTLKSLNGKVKNVITSSLGLQESTLYIKGQEMNGYSLQTAMKDVEEGNISDVKITSHSGSTELLDMSDDAVRGAWQILFGVTPEFFYDRDGDTESDENSNTKGKGLFQLQRFKVDAFGNIWGSRSTSSESTDYVLVMPACLNPYVFQNKDNGTKYCLPVANAFGTGAMIDISDERYNLNAIKDETHSDLNFQRFVLESFNSNSSLLSFNNMWYFARKNDDTRNLLSIYGINSPSTQLDKTLQNFNDTRAHLDNMINSDLNIKSEGSEDYLALALDFRQFKPHEIKSNWNGVKYMAQSYQNGLNNGSAEQLKPIEYLGKGSLIPMSKVDASFSWFNFNSENLNNSINSNSLKGLDLQNFVKTQSIFYLNEPSADASVRTLYAKCQPSVLLSYMKDGATAAIQGTGFTDKEYMALLDGSLHKINEFNSITSKMFLWRGSVATDSSVGTAADVVEFIYGAGANADEMYPWLIQSEYNFSSAEILNASVYKTFTANAQVLAELQGTKAGETVTYKYTDAGDGGSGTREYKIYTSIANKSNMWANIYWAYTMKLLNIKSLDSVGTFDFEALPHSPVFDANNTGSLAQAMAAISENDDKSNSANTYEEKQKKLIDIVTDLLTNGTNNNRNGILRSIINGFFIDTHKSITGSRLASSITAGVSTDTSTSYSSAVGYISSPPLKDLPFTSWVAKNYTYIYLFLLLLITITLIMMVLTNLRTWRQGIAIFIVMAFALILPQSLLNNAITIGNKFADGMFNDRFTYWAIVEQELSIKNNNLAARQGNLVQQIQDNIDRSVIAYQDEATGVKVKWMSPKKNNVFEALFNDVLSDSALGNNLTIFKWLFNSFFTGDEYVNDDPLTTYVYRSYTDIAKDAKNYYDNARTLSFTASDIRKEVIKRASVSARVNGENLKFIGADYYVDSTGRGSINDYICDIYGNTTFDDSSPFNVHTGYGILQAHLQYSVKSRLSSESEQNSALKVGLGTDTVPRQDVNMATAGYGHRFWHLTSDEVLDAVLLKDPADNTSPGLSVGVSGSGTYTTDPGTQMYLAYTESPYYYFYNVLKERFAVGATESSDGTQTTGTNMKQNLMDENSYKYIQNTMDSDGDIRDFLDMEGLFTTVIPVLYEGNLYVREYERINGLNIETYNFDDVTDSSVTDTLAFKEGKLKKQKMRNVWNMYCPWVDYMYELDAFNKKATYMGNKVTVGDTLNPGSYDEVGRPMIYSEADMSAKHMDYHNLTEVERRIQNVLESTYIDMLYLLNYYDFDNETLISTAAMFATFNFNREFSGSALVGNNAIIYPQSFELKNFNYDAFLRLTLMNATGIPLSDTSTDMYEVILNKTSWWTGLMIIAVDVLACYAIPACKVLIMLLLLFLGLAFCVTCVVTPPEKVLQSLGKSIVFPTILYMLCNMAFAAVVALLMGEGLVSYVGSRTENIAINDPTVTVLMLILVDSIYIWMLIKIIKLLFTTFKSFGISSVMGIAAVAAGLGATYMGKGSRALKTLVFGSIKRAFNRRDMRKSFQAGMHSDNSNSTRSNLPDNSPSRHHSYYRHYDNQNNHTSNKNKEESKDEFRRTVEAKASHFGDIKTPKNNKRKIGRASVKVTHLTKKPVHEELSSKRPVRRELSSKAPVSTHREHSSKDFVSKHREHSSRDLVRTHKKLSSKDIVKVHRELSSKRPVRKELSPKDLIRAHNINSPM